MGPGHQTVQIDPSQIIFCQKYHVMGRHFHNGGVIRLLKDIQIVQSLHVMLGF